MNNAGVIVMQRKTLKGVLVMLGILLLSVGSVYAEQTAKLVGTYTGEESISVYVKGMDSVEDIRCQIGTHAEQQISCETVENMKASPKTLIMLDNSLSIGTANRDKLKDVIEEYAYDKTMQELISIVTFSEDSIQLVDFVSDKNSIKDAMEQLEYMDQETYLTDVLYEILESSYFGNEDCYKKIIIISDGVDNKSIGYTKEELYDLIKEKNIPIYTIGCVNKNNSEQLENMFAISRYTNADSWILDEIENTNVIVDEILKDNQVIHATILPDEQLMDGSMKNVMLQSGGTQIEFTVKMPSKAMVETPSPAEVQEETLQQQEETPQQEEVPQQEQDTKPQGMRWNIPYKWIILVAVLLVAVVSVVLVTVLIVRNTKKRKQQEGFVTLPEPVNFVRQMDQGVTEIVNVPLHDSGETQMLWGQEAKTYQLILTDISNAARSFQMPMQGTVIIGRKPQEANLVIDFDKSVSGKHCQISERNGKFYIKDLQSANGTFVNDSRILSEVEIHSGCRITLGRVIMKVEIK